MNGQAAVALVLGIVVTMFVPAEAGRTGEAMSEYDRIFEE